MNINGDVHFDGWPRADVKDFTDNMEPGFCVLCLVDTDQKQHQLFLKPAHLARARLAAAAFDDDLCELRRLLDIAEADAQIADDDAEAAKPDAHLPPPKRTIWVAVWMRLGSGVIEVLDRETEEAAERCCRFSHRRRIAVLGPIDVEAEP